jgi:ferric-dicitrate binding protein FerR (iron transport regulator)
MTKNLLLKFITGVAQEGEKRAVLEWIGNNPNNLHYFTGLKNLWVYNNMPQSLATLEEMKAATLITDKYSRNSRYSRDKKYLSDSTGGTKIKRSPFKRYIILAAASVAILLTVNILQFIKNRSLTTETQVPVIALSDIPFEHKHTLYTNNGVKGFVELPDGSKVWLNSATTLTYPDKFAGATREVMVAGEALFDVVTDSLKPMIVNTNRDFKIEVLGTKFNVRTYENDYEAQTTLISGSINLIREIKKGERVIIAQLKPTESFVIRDKNAPVLIKQIDTTKQMAWKQGLLIFESTPMDEVIKKLERWHGTQFIIQDYDILKTRLTANFRSESIVQIMEMIKFCTPIEYTIKENIVTLNKKS